MDVLGGPSILTVSRRRARLVSMLVVAGWIEGCSGSAPPKTIPSPPESFNELKQKIAVASRVAVQA